MLSERPLVVGSSERCDVRIEGAAPDHVSIGRDVVEALAACVVGKVRLAPQERRLLVPECVIELGDAKLVVREDTKPPASIPTRELAIRMMGGGGADERLLPTILVVQGPDAGSSIALPSQRTLTVGRAPSCDLRIAADDGLSRVHVEVILQDGVTLIRDVGSTSGTFLGARRLQPNRRAVWEPDTMLRLGETTVLALRLPDWVRTTTDELLRTGRAGKEEKNDSEPVKKLTASEEPASDLRVAREGGTSAGIALVEKSTLSPAAPKTKPPGGRLVERMVAVVAILAILIGVAMLVWILR